MCSSFHEGGFCEKGEECLFDHVGREGIKYRRCLQDYPEVLMGGWMKRRESFLA